jgi:hypothetical protein
MLVLIFQARENAPSGPKVDTSGPRKRGPLEKVARLRGLPFSAGQEELRTFFGNGKDIEIAKRGIHFLMNHRGASNGEAFVIFNSAESLALALEKHRETIGER